MEELSKTDEELTVDLSFNLNADLIQIVLSLIWGEFLQNKFFAIDSFLPLKYYKIDKRGAINIRLEREWIELDTPFLLTGYRSANFKKPVIMSECQLKMRTSGEISPGNLGIDELDIEIGKTRGYFFSGWSIPISTITSFLLSVFRKKLETKLISQIQLGWNDVYKREESKILDWISQYLDDRLPENYSLTKVFIRPGIPGGKLWQWQIKGIFGKQLSTPVEVSWKKGLQWADDNKAVLRVPYVTVPDLVPEFSFNIRRSQVGLILNEMREAEGNIIANLKVIGAIRGSLTVEFPLDTSGNVQWNFLEVYMDLKSKNLLTLGITLFKRKTKKAIEDELKGRLSTILNQGRELKSFKLDLYGENQLEIAIGGPSMVRAFGGELIISFDISLNITPETALENINDRVLKK
nr:hypothetical protein [Saprospiraceae bacterium]